MDALAPRTIRYIKLATNGAWVEECLARGELQVDFMMVPHDLALAGDRNAIGAAIRADGYANGSAARLTGQLLDFCELGADCLWFTIAEGKLRWAYAGPEVTWLGGDRSAHGLRKRDTLDGWRCTNIKGAPLIAARPSTGLTKVAMTRNTIVNGEPYREALRALINAEESALVARARQAERELLMALGEAVMHLHQDDFETLVDLIFGRSGWHLVSALGGNQADLDLAVEQPIFGERAFIQVKSQAGCDKLRDRVERYEACATPVPRFRPDLRCAAPERKAIHVF
jgi:hypothetical protein